MAALVAYQALMQGRTSRHSGGFLLLQKRLDRIQEYATKRTHAAERGLVYP